ncbi:MAG: lipoyl(octanoyl) transferase LipB [Thermodesulfobacteriota bacterium]
MISRGGDVTFHGPGQLVGYPIFDLSVEKDVHKYLRRLEDAIILALRPYGIPARSIEGVTGVWAKWHKIASIGVGVKKWITYHGFALNVNTELSYFDLIVPVRYTGRQDDLHTEVAGEAGRGRYGRGRGEYS